MIFVFPAISCSFVCDIGRTGLMSSIEVIFSGVAMSLLLPLMNQHFVLIKYSTFLRSIPLLSLFTERFLGMDKQPDITVADLSE